MNVWSVWMGFILVKGSYANISIICEKKYKVSCTQKWLHFSASYRRGLKGYIHSVLPNTSKAGIEINPLNISKELNLPVLLVGVIPLTYDNACTLSSFPEVLFLQIYHMYHLPFSIFPLRMFSNKFLLDLQTNSTFKDSSQLHWSTYLYHCSEYVLKFSIYTKQCCINYYKAGLHSKHTD